jgi:hypothetical protein
LPIAPFAGFIEQIISNFMHNELARINHP